MLCVLLQARYIMVVLRRVRLCCHAARDETSLVFATLRILATVTPVSHYPARGPPTSWITLFIDHWTEVFSGSLHWNAELVTVTRPLTSTAWLLAVAASYVFKTSPQTSFCGPVAHNNLSFPVTALSLAGPIWLRSISHCQSTLCNLLHNGMFNTIVIGTQENRAVA